MGFVVMKVLTRSLWRELPFRSTNTGASTEADIHPVVFNCRLPD